jgi:small subunit ribosomal protein S1
MPETNNIIVSRKAAIEKANSLDAEQLEVGSIVTAKIKSIAKYGAFATVGGIDGLIHNSELSYTRITDPAEVVSIGQEIKVKIVSITEDENGRKRIELSYKQAYPDPWDSIQVKEGDIVDARVVNISSYGIFVSVDNVEALVHKSELSWTKKNPEPVSYAAVGDTIRVKIQHVDLKKRQISASLKEAQGDPWASVVLEKGDVIEAKITTVANYGFFMEITDGIEGLLHVNDLGWTKIERETIKASLKVGDIIRVVVSDIDIEKKRIALSLKHLN